MDNRLKAVSAALVALALVFTSIPTSVFANAYDYNFLIRNSDDTATTTVALPKSPTNKYGFIAGEYNGTVPVWNTFSADNFHFQPNAFGGYEAMLEQIPLSQIDGLDAVYATDVHLDNLRIAEDNEHNSIYGLMSEQAAQSDWDDTATGSYAYIKNKPTLATVATTGSYNDLSDKPATTTFTRTATTTSRSIVTGTGSTGFQVSSTKDADVHYSATIVSTASIAGSAQGRIVLEGATTNSATAGDWKELGRCTNGQALSLAITLQSVQTLGCQISAFVPAGTYVKIRSINDAGTPSYTYNSGQEVTYN